jgi:hypothetical protein
MNGISTSAVPRFASLHVVKPGEFLVDQTQSPSTTFRPIRSTMTTPCNSQSVSQTTSPGGASDLRSRYAASGSRFESTISGSPINRPPWSPSSRHSRDYTRVEPRTYKVDLIGYMLSSTEKEGPLWYTRPNWNHAAVRRVTVDLNVPPTQANYDRSIERINRVLLHDLSAARELFGMTAKNPPGTPPDLFSYRDESNRFLRVNNLGQPDGASDRRRR